MKKVEDHPIEDCFGDEISSNDVYFVIARDVVLESNLKRYLLETELVECYQAM